MVLAPLDPPPPADDPNLANLTTDQLAALVFAGDPEVYYEQARAIDAATERLQQVLDGIRHDARLIHEALDGEVLIAFDDVSHRLGASVDAVLQAAWNPGYAASLRAAGDALAASQQRFRDLRGKQAEQAAAPPAPDAPAPEVVQAQHAESALQIVRDLGTAYRDIGTRITPLPLINGAKTWQAPDQAAPEPKTVNSFTQTGVDLFQGQGDPGTHGAVGAGFGPGAFAAGGPGAGTFGGAGGGAFGRRETVTSGGVPGDTQWGFAGAPVVGRAPVETTAGTTWAPAGAGDQATTAGGDPWAAAISPAQGVVTAASVGLPPAVLGRSSGLGTGAPQPTGKRERTVIAARQEDESTEEESTRRPQDRGEALDERQVRVTSDPSTEHAVPAVVPVLPVTVSAAPPVTAAAPPVTAAPATLAATSAPVVPAPPAAPAVPAVAPPPAHSGGTPTILAIATSSGGHGMPGGTVTPAAGQFGPPPVRPLATDLTAVQPGTGLPGAPAAHTSFNGHTGPSAAPGYGPMNPMGLGGRGPGERDNERFAEIPLEADAGVWQNPVGATVLGRPPATEQKSPSPVGSPPAEQPTGGPQRSEEDAKLLEQAREQALQMLGRTSERER